MSATSKFYFTQAALEEVAAEGAVLDNVRECHLRSARAWLVLAERLKQAETSRAEQTAKKALLDAMTVWRRPSPSPKITGDMNEQDCRAPLSHRQG